MRACLLLALFGCVILAKVSANFVDIEEFHDSWEDKKIADEKENFAEHEQDDKEEDDSEFQDDLDGSGSQDDDSVDKSKNETEEESNESSPKKQDEE
ncbi:hypothetical protein M5D96_009338 [Drosophila gunungcola]|uniref:Uncharacterized protein n=1 Tax=Drosophila gunungcola TaxID=103775 RepID=A0A9Q0BMN0_9MUSC|nr:hypothetical protein M5D96_009338 [Drosophila gunungcola]